MLLSEIFDHLNYGELSQLDLAGATSTGVPSASYPALVSHLNISLVELYKRFPLRLREIDIKLDASITEYKLEVEYSIITGTVTEAIPVLYLIDTVADPFITRNVLKIERVETDDTDVTEDLRLNDISDDDSVFTTAFNYLKVPTPNDTDTLTVHYRSAPDHILVAGLDPSTVSIPIPDSLLEPLVYYMAARAHANLPGMDGNMGEHSLYLQKFEASVAKIKQLGLVENNHTRNTRFEDNGWV
jgi:hypothetical protein